MVEDTKADKPPEGVLINSGAGMFPTKDGIAAAKLAFRATRSFVKEKRKSLSLDKALLRGFRKVSSEYFHDSFHYQTTLAKGNKELKARSKASLALHERLRAASTQAIFSIEKEVQYSVRNKDARGFVADILPRINQIKEACEAPLKLKGKKGKSMALHNCCDGLWRVREEMSGCAFTWTFDTAAGKGGEQFAHQDALFVQVAMKAIDPDVQLKSIKSELKSISKAVFSLK